MWQVVSGIGVLQMIAVAAPAPYFMPELRSESSG
jgi:hypothetical protein